MASLSQRSVVPLLGLFLGFSITWILKSQRGDRLMVKDRLPQSLLTDRHHPGGWMALLPRNGPANLDSWRLAVDTARSNKEFQQLAERLLASSRQAMSESLWALLFERWSEFEPKAMVDFAEAIEGHASNKAIQEMAYFAWASRLPEVALAKARFCSTAIQHAALEGAVATQPDKAAAFALSLPNAQWAIGRVTMNDRVPESELQKLLPQCIYDGPRQPVQKALRSRLIIRNPELALTEALKAGRIHSDPVAGVIEEVAGIDLEKAHELLQKLPMSRGRAQASTLLARRWATTDPEAAIHWSETQLHGSVRRHALLEIADTIGGADPAKGLELVERVGWKETRNFYAPVHVNGEEVSTNEGHHHAKAGPLRQALFRGLAITDPQAARDYLERVPRSFRSTFAKLIEAELPAETE